MYLDFSRFHPLDHSFRACKGYPGGRPRHLRYWWEFQQRERLTIWLLHLFRQHLWTVVQVRDRKNGGDWRTYVACAGCDAEPSTQTALRLLENTHQPPS